MVSFFTAGSWEKDTENGALGKIFGPSYFVTALEFSILYDFQILNVLFVIKFSNFSQLSWRNTDTEKYWKYQYLEIKIGSVIISIIGDVVKLWDILYLDLVFLQLVTQRYCGVTTTINVMVSFNSGRNYVDGIGILHELSAPNLQI